MLIFPASLATRVEASCLSSTDWVHPRENLNLKVGAGGWVLAGEGACRHGQFLPVNRLKAWFFSNLCNDSENLLLDQARVGFYCWQMKTISDISLSWTHLHQMPGWFSWLIFPSSSYKLLFDFNASYSCTGGKMHSLLPATRVELTGLLKILLVKDDHMEIRKIELFGTWSTEGPQTQMSSCSLLHPWSNSIH